MLIKKYPQSCLMIKTQNHTIVVDPGSLKYKDSYLKDWQQADAIFITHKHFDHINKDALKDINVPIYSTKEVQNAYPEINFNIVKDGNIINLDNIKIEVVKAIHGYNPKLKNGGEVLENVGYIIDDGEKRLYITSDTICFNNNYQADVVALPVTAHGLTMSAYEASLYALDLGAKLVIPTHMDNEVYPPDMDYMQKCFNEFNINYQVLDIEEEIEI